MSGMLERRFERYCASIMETLGHADRHAPAQWYLKGLLLPGDRKSVEPMAARVCPENVRSAHQSMHHLVAAADWDDAAVLAAVARQVVPELLKQAEHCWWIIDDTGHAKKGRKSVGVARQSGGASIITPRCVSPPTASSCSNACAVKKRRSIPPTFRTRKFPAARQPGRCSATCLGRSPPCASASHALYRSAHAAEHGEIGGIERHDLFFNIVESKTPGQIRCRGFAARSLSPRRGSARSRCRGRSAALSPGGCR